MLLSYYPNRFAKSLQLMDCKYKTLILHFRELWEDPRTEWNLPNN